jgi:hypothetical protein
LTRPKVHAYARTQLQVQYAGTGVASDHSVRRIGILTAGGDTPALNATIHGAVMRANQLRVEVIGLIKGFNCLFNPRVPHVHLNPLYQEIPSSTRRAAGRSSAPRATSSTRSAARISTSSSRACSGSASTGSSASAATVR